MNALQTFHFEEQEVRTQLVDGVVLFVANDVARTLGYMNPSKATNDHCKKAIKMWGNDSLGRPQEFKFIPEADVFRLVIKSKLPSAEKFEDWVMEEVLPAIRKHGAYMTPSKIEEVLLNPDTIINLATQLKQERFEKEKALTQLKKQEPQVIFARSVEVSQNSVAVKVLATILKQNGIDVGQNRMFQWLRDNKYLSGRQGKSWNMPTQKSMDLGLFELKANTYFHNNGVPETNYTPLVTGKGQVYFVNKFSEHLQQA